MGKKKRKKKKHKRKKNVLSKLSVRWRLGMRMCCLSAFILALNSTMISCASFTATFAFYFNLFFN